MELSTEYKPFWARSWARLGPTGRALIFASAHAVAYSAVVIYLIKSEARAGQGLQFVALFYWMPLFVVFTPMEAFTVAIVSTDFVYGRGNGKGKTGELFFILIALLLAAAVIVPQLDSWLYNNFSINLA